MKLWRIFLVVCLMVLNAVVAHAACTGPAGAAGQMTYASNLSMMVYCDGTSWVSMAGGVSVTIGGTTNNPGGNNTNIQYNSGGAFAGSDNFAWVNGTNTVSVTGTVSATYGYFKYISATNGGLGVSALASLTDVSASSPASGMLLRYNGSKWESVGASTALSTTTVFQDWPDAIICGNPSNDTVPIVLNILSKNSGGGGTYAYPSASANIYVSFNADGTFNAAGGLGVATTGSYICSTAASTTISSLYAAGRAFNFIGSGSGSNALGDRITSNTTSIVAQTGGVISITTNGTTTGYFDTAGRLVVPGISLTQNYGVSSTTGYFSGKVGIGTTAPTNPLTVVGSTAQIRLNNSTGNVGGYIFSVADPNLNLSAGGDYSGGWIARNTDVASIASSGASWGFYINSGLTPGNSFTPTMRMFLNASGLGIGTTTQAASLTVVGEVQVSNSGVACSASTAGAIRYQSGSLKYCNGSTFNTLSAGSGVPGGISGSIQFNSNGSFAGRSDLMVDSAGNVGIGIASGAPLTNGSSFTTMTLSGTLGGILETTYMGGLVGRFYSQGNAVYIQNYTNNPIYFGTNVGGGGSTGGMAFTSAGNLGIGATSPAARLVVSKNASAPQSPYLSGVNIAVAQFVAADATNTRVLADAHGGIPTFDLRRSNGTAAAPSALATDDVMGQFTWYGYGSTAYSSSVRAAIRAGAAENWTDAYQGTYMSFWTTPTSSTGVTERMRIAGSGYVGIGTSSPVAKLNQYGGRFYIQSDGTDPATVTSGKGLIATYLGSSDYGLIASYDTTGAAYKPLYLEASSLVLNKNSAGNVGIGMGPGYPLDVSGSIRIYNASSNLPQLTLQNSSRSWSIYNNVGLSNYFDIYDATAAAHRFVIDTNGKVGIGTTGPSYKLDVTDSGTAIHGNNSGGGAYGVMGDAGAGGWGIFCNSGLCGGYANWSNASDQRLKTDIKALPNQDGLAAIIKLNPVRFHWKDRNRDKQDGEQLGFIAQDVERILPELVTTSISETTIDVGHGKREVIIHPKTMSYSTLVVPLVRAVQQLKADNDNLHSELRALKAANDNLAREMHELRQAVKAGAQAR